jgi:hypothetical protein
MVRQGYVQAHRPAPTAALEEGGTSAPQSNGAKPSGRTGLVAGWGIAAAAVHICAGGTCCKVVEQPLQQWCGV